MSCNIGLMYLTVSASLCTKEHCTVVKLVFNRCMHSGLVQELSLFLGDHLKKNDIEFTKELTVVNDIYVRHSNVLRCCMHH